MSEHPIPVEALDSDIAILGRKGGGKTYTSKGIVERLLDLGRRVLVLDPLGVWAGLRTSADGERAGYKVAIFGGLHADLPLDPAAAVPMARIVATENLPAVIDLSDLSKHAQQAFLLTFLHELRRVNKEALTIVLEEADVFAPQNPQGDDSKQLHSEIDWIARRGRFKGFRLISICQRPARLSKDVLTQANMLVMHRLPSPQDQGAGMDWIKSNGDMGRAKEVESSLGSLKVGEAWVLAQEPAMLERAMFPPIKTLDTSSTPKAGESRIEPKTLAEVDVSAIEAALAEAAKQGAPKTAGKALGAAEVAAAEERGYQRGFAAGEALGRDAMRSEAVATMQAALTALGSAAPVAVAVAPPVASVPAPKRATPRVVSNGAMDPLLAAALSVWPARLGWGALAAMCGRKARGGHFNTARKRLVEGGLLREDGDLVTPTNPPQTPEGAIPADLLERNLPQPAAKMFTVIRQQPGISVASLGARLDMQTRGGHWNTGMSTLRRNGLINENGDALYVRGELLGN